jgi:hypothetical protein
MKELLKKYAQDPNFELGLLKWLGAIDKRFENINSFAELLDKGLMSCLLEFTWIH